jgi:group I intron endonuclease
MHTAPNGKSYIGQTCDLERRNAVHKSSNGCRAFANAIKKYGWDSFTHSVLAEGLSLEEANSQEAALIQKYGTLSPGGYNLKTGGKNGGRPSDESIRKSADARRGKPLPEAQRKRLSELGKAMPRDRIEKMVIAAKAARERNAGVPHFNLGRKHGDEHRRKTSEASIARWQDDAYRRMVIESRTGKKRSEDTKRKQSEAAKRRWEERRKIGDCKEDPLVTIKRAESIRETWRIKKEAAQGDLFGENIQA